MKTALFDKVKSNVKVHRTECVMVNTAGRRYVKIKDPGPLEYLDWKLRGIKVVECKCLKGSK